MQVSVDTFSASVYTSAHAGGKGEHAAKHLLQAFSVLGVPKEIKRDNGPAYVSKAFSAFLQEWGVEHILHSPTGQAVVERAHQPFKKILKCQWESSRGFSPQEHLSKALFTINFLNCSFDMSPPIVRQFSPHGGYRDKKHPPILRWDPENRSIKGLYKLVIWEHGYACVSTPEGLRCIPQKWVKLYIHKHPVRPPDGPSQVSVVNFA